MWAERQNKDCFCCVWARTLETQYVINMHFTFSTFHFKVLAESKEMKSKKSKKKRESDLDGVYVDTCFDNTEINTSL